MRLRDRPKRIFLLSILLIGLSSCIFFSSGFIGQTVADSFPIMMIWLALGTAYIILKTSLLKLGGSDNSIHVGRRKCDILDQTSGWYGFHGLKTALSNNVGLGSIAGIAVGISLGGPGAAFWMIAGGLLPMILKFAGSLLSHSYSEIRPDRQAKNRAIYYLSNRMAEKGLSGTGKALSVIFALFSIGGAIVGGSAFQVNQSLKVLEWIDPTLGEYPWVYGLLMAFFVALVIVARVHRIASAASMVVPVVCAIYLIATLLILLSNYWLIPGAFKMMLIHALSAKAIYGGIIGALVMGCQCAVPSNEGAGHAPIRKPLIKHDYSSRKDAIAFIEPFIDRVTVCAMTALVMVITGAYSDPAYENMIAGSNGAAITTRVMGEHLSWSPYLLSIAVLLFAYSSMISWFYYGKRIWKWLFEDEQSIIFYVIFLTCALLGSIINSTSILNAAALMIFGIVVSKTVGVVMLSKSIKLDMRNYRAMKETDFAQQKRMELRRLPKAA